ncbi:MAG: hypothetical protein AAF560_33515, partial [Acidobacteriota bacterium]
AVVCGGSEVSVVDVAARAEIDTFDLGHDCQVVDICDDGSVLVGWISISDNGRRVRRLEIDGAGQLSDTGESITPDFPVNVHCAPGSNTALILQLGFDVTSIAVAGLGTRDQVTTATAPGSAIFQPDQGRVSIRAEGAIDVYDYDTASGVLSDTPALTIPGTGSLVPMGGIDTMAADPSTGLLYVTDDDTLGIYDATTGSAATPIVKPGADFTGVCFGGDSSIFSDGFESGDTGAWS